MTIKFLGGHNASGGLQFYDTSSATVAPTASTAQHRSGAYSILLNAGSSDQDSWATKQSIMPTGAGRLSIGCYAPSLPANNANLAYFGTGNGGLDVLMTTAGKVAIGGQSGGSGIVLKTSTATPGTGAWFTVSIAYSITSISNYTLKVYINGTLDMTITNADGSLWTDATTNLYLGFTTGGQWGINKTLYIDDVFVDDDSSVTIPGDIRVANKKPFASSMAQFDDTKTAAQRVTAVSQRPLLTTTASTDRIIHAGTSDVAETFKIENRATGDTDLTNAVILGYTGWIWKAVSSTSGTALWDIICNEVTTALADATSTAYALATNIVTTSVYPETLNAIGMRSTTIAADTLFGEAGVLVAYYAGSADPNQPGALIQAASGRGVAATSVVKAFASNVTAGSLLVVDVGCFDTTGWADGNVTDNKGQTYTRVDTVVGTNVRGAVYYCKNAAAGATTITADNGNTSDKSIAIHEYSGMDTSSPLDQSGKSANNSASTTYACGTTGSDTYAYDLVHYMAVSEGNVGILVPPSGTNKRCEELTTINLPITTADKWVSATGTQTGSFTGGNSQPSVGMVVTFKQTTSGITGTLSKTLGALTSSTASGLRIDGSVSKTLGALTRSIAGTLRIDGSVSKTLGALTSSTASKVYTPGTLAKTLGSLTSSTASGLRIDGSASKTLGALTSSAAGGPRVDGTTTKTLGALTISSAGTLNNITGDVSKTLGALTSITASSLRIDGSVSKTLGALASSTASALRIDGATAKTLGALTASSSGALQVTGSVSKTLDALTSSSAATATNRGSVSQTLGALTSTASGNLGSTEGSLSQTLGALTSSSSATAYMLGAVSSTLGALTSSASGILNNITGDVSKTLDPLTLGAAGGPRVDGSLSKTLGALTSSAFGTSALSGSLSKTLDALTSQAAGSLSLTGSSVKTLGELLSTSVGSLRIDGSFSKSLDALISTSSSGLRIDAALSKTLGVLTVQSHGTVTSGLAGDLIKTLGTLTAQGVGTLRIDGSVSKTLGAATSQSTGTLSLGGSLSKTLGSLTSQSQSRLRIDGATARTLGDVTLQSQGGAGTSSGSLAKTLGALIGSSSGQLVIGAALSRTLGAVSVSAASELRIDAVLDSPLAALVLSAAGHGPYVAPTRVYTTTTESLLYAGVSTETLIYESASSETLVYQGVSAEV